MPSKQQAKAERSRLRRAKKSKHLKLQHLSQKVSKQRHERIKRQQLKAERRIRYEIDRCNSIDELRLLAKLHGVDDREIFSWTKQDSNMAKACIAEASLNKERQ